MRVVATVHERTKGMSTFCLFKVEAENEALEPFQSTRDTTQPQDNVSPEQQRLLDGDNQAETGSATAERDL